MSDPLPVDPRPPAAVGTAAWTVLLALTLVRREDLAAAGREWWVWACLVGVAVGVVGLGWATWLTRRRQRTAAGGGAGSPAPAVSSPVPSPDD